MPKNAALKIDSLSQDQAYFWVDGCYGVGEASDVPVLTHALHYGFAVFEGIRGYGGSSFALKDHLDRLILSAARLGISSPYSALELIDVVEALEEQAQLNQFYVRPLIWTGGKAMGISARKSDVHVGIVLWNWQDHFADIQKRGGLRLMISPYARLTNQMAPLQAKSSFLYGPNVMSKTAAEKAGFDDALSLDERGRIMEGTGANIFFVKGDCLVTPVPDYFLNGITRQTIIEIALKKGLRVFEQDLFLSDLPQMDEAFLTGTAYEVSPIQRIGDVRFERQTIANQLRDDYLSVVIIDGC